MIEINPGVLKYPIEVRKVHRTIVNGSYQDDVPVRVAAMFAAVRGVKASEQTLRDAEQHVETVEFTTRWRDDLDSSMHVHWQGRDYEIERMDPVPYKRLYRRIWATCTVGVGGAG